MLHDWLSSYQELPIQGVGILRWQRTPAQQTSKSAIAAPVWALTFQADPHAAVSEDFFARLAVFAHTTVQAVQEQYQQWIRCFQETENSVDLWGVGSLVKDSFGNWSGAFTQLTALPAASLARMKRSKKSSSGSWRWTDQLVVLMLLLALGWLIWVGREAGFRWGTHSFKSFWKIQSAPTPEATYREIR